MRRERGPCEGGEPSGRVPRAVRGAVRGAMQGGERGAPVRRASRAWSTAWPPRAACPPALRGGLGAWSAKRSATADPAPGQAAVKTVGTAGGDVVGKALSPRSATSGQQRHKPTSGQQPTRHAGAGQLRVLERVGRVRGGAAAQDVGGVGGRDAGPRRPQLLPPPRAQALRRPTPRPAQAMLGQG